ncbi:MAG: cobalamin biosynthesis protein CobD/CbiB [Alphaproteobacteria bacterium]
MLSPQAAPPDTIDPLILWLMVIVADALFSGLPGLRQVLSLPLAAVGRLTLWLDEKLNRERRSVANRLMRGALTVCVLAVAAGAAGWIVAAVARSVPGGWLIEAAILACLVLQRRMIDPMRRVARGLAAHDLESARRALAELVSYDGAGLDEHAVARGAVEVGTARFCDGVVASAFWYLLLGLPGLCAWRVVNVIADRIGDASPRHDAFGLVAARLDEALGMLPALFAGPVLCMAAAFVPSASPSAAFSVWLQALRSRGIFDSGRGQGAMAGALGVVLATPRRPDNAVAGAAWVGDGRARIGASDVIRAVILLVVACIIFAAFLAAMVVARGLG